MAEVSHEQRLVIIPMMTFELAATSAPRTSRLPRDRSQLLRESRRIARGSCAETTRLLGIVAQLKVTAKVGDLGRGAVASNLFYVT